MRRILLSVVACCAVIALVPASALAHGRHHKRHHRAHHARVRHEHFGSQGNNQNKQGQNPSPTAGTIQSFSNGVLTIALTDGSTVSGKVTNDTRIECQAAETSSGNSGWHSHHHGGDNGGGDNGGNNDQGDDDNDHAAQTCDTSSLTPTTVVQEAELKVSSAGAVWDKLDLMSASTQSTQPSHG